MNPEKNDKWLMFKNYLHNELGITKDDIRAWIKEACHEVADRMIAQEFEKFNVKEIVSSIVKDDRYWGSTKVHDDVRRIMAEELVKRVIIADRMA